MTAAKVSLYSLSDLKTTLDDHIPIYLSTATTPSNAPLPRALRFQALHTTTYIRLSLGYSAVAIAAYAFYLDYYLKLDFKDTKAFTAFAVVGYFTLNTLLTLWLWYGERAQVFAGTRHGKGQQKDVNLSVRSLPPHNKYDPVYRIVVAWNEGSGGSSNTLETTAAFTRFFAADGRFVPAEFEAWLRREIPVVEGSAGVASTELKSSVEANPVVAAQVSRMEELVEVDEDDMVLVGGTSQAAGSGQQLPGTATGTSSTPSAKKRSKRKA